MLYSEGGRRKLHRPENLNQRRFSKPFNPIEDAKRPSWVCAVTRRRFPVGASPTRQPLQPEAAGAAMEVTKWLKPSDSVPRNTVAARVCRP